MDLTVEHSENYKEISVALMRQQPGAINVKDKLPDALAGNGVAIAYYDGSDWMMGGWQSSTTRNQHDTTAMMHLENFASNVDTRWEQIDTRLVAMDAKAVARWEQLNTRLMLMETNALARSEHLENQITAFTGQLARWFQSDVLPIVSNAVVTQIKPFLVKLLDNGLPTFVRDVVDTMEQHRCAVVASMGRPMILGNVWPFVVYVALCS